jgi:hypothetical protein
MKNLTNLLKRKLTTTTTNKNDKSLFNENFDQLFTSNNKKQNYVINLSKFNLNDINCASSPITTAAIKRSSMQKFRKVLSKKLKNIITTTTTATATQNTPKKLKTNVELINYNAIYSSSMSSQYNIEQKRTIFQQNSFLLYNNVISTSTPIENKRVKLLTSTTTSFYKIKQPSFDDEDDDDEVIEYVDANEQTTAYNYNDSIDESTQVNINELPKLIESTFNSSSCSNMSNDLIILQHVYKTTAHQSVVGQSIKLETRYVDIKQYFMA